MRLRTKVSVVSSQVCCSPEPGLQLKVFAHPCLRLLELTPVQDTATRHGGYRHSSRAISDAHAAVLDIILQGESVC